MDYKRKINHLYWRAGFGLSPSEFDRYNLSVKDNVQKLFNQAQKDKTRITSLAGPNLDDEMSKKEKRKSAVQSVQKIKNDWLIRMTKPEHSALLERMCLFWHGHFACRIVLANKIAASYLSTIRDNALGNFGDLLHSMAKEPAMIRYLNNQQNRKGQPNENFARELMELFTLGRGHYTEKDISESARAFTGWSSNMIGNYVFRSRQHDYGVKEFLGKKGRFNGEEIIDIILSKRQTARFITEKIYKYFVNDKIDTKIIDELSRDFYSSNYDISRLMKSIFQADWFYKEKNIGNKVKSPIEFVVGLIKTLNIEVGNDLALISIQRQLGQILLNPPNVAGWPGGLTWIDNSTLLTRLNLATFILNSSGTVSGELTPLKNRFKNLKLTCDLAPINDFFGSANKSELPQMVSDVLINGEAPDLYKIKYGIRFKKQKDYFNTVLMTTLSVPEYQMC